MKRDSFQVQANIRMRIVLDFLGRIATSKGPIALMFVVIDTIAIYFRVLFISIFSFQNVLLQFFDRASLLGQRCQVIN